ncbi:4,5-DOPA dioxygenase extradiol-like protein [Monoraphidium neglectum]|uniref:4,5-DOPA dioxygenase extradiol-like protein n=1 Tax=Monoraphidium neglectum TaxID=145388 RepID=A0A0D2N0G0_9CHLO|nr:4,5-DOPA dioxygenase extradiol-like protein [Monoraphidium neglectum]KIY99800.1 4,5-DOPA dioxygenase extradiol-like protein [Monoraphidium neglectum]|eukprot:XP_013898820.1 4,5-DOPA dioxygenase extradiol-like protein [Monoraphidium neglectum]
MAPGGPLPVLGDPAHVQLTASLRSLPGRLPAAPTAILLCSAHFEAAQPTVIAEPPSHLLYDYGGFPPESYQLQYRPPGQPALAQSVLRLLRGAGFEPQLESSGRGLDHGAFIPLMLMYPSAAIPVVELSILASLAPEDHVRMGEALRPLRDEGVLIVGSGSSFHSIPEIIRATRGRPGSALIGQVRAWRPGAEVEL